VIYVTIGGKSTYGFLRLIRKMDEIAPELHERMLMQIGDTEYRPVNAEYFTYNSFNESIRLFKEADIVVSHCSTGTILNVRTFRPQKPTIVVPRRSIHGELVDDHQMELASVIESSAGGTSVSVVYDVEELKERILEAARAGSYGESGGEGLRNPLIEYIRDYIASLQ
jgi:beta-1,4-N-acetylglucosaminyltransferase